MKLSIETGIYNERRYGKPYIGIVNPADGKVTSWGAWIGTPGCKGLLEIEAKPGSIIIRGQKDNRGNNGTPDYAIVQEDGTLEYMGKADAIKAAREFQSDRAEPEPTLDDMLAALGVRTTREAMAYIASMKAAA